MPMVFVYFFGGLALIVLLTSCFTTPTFSIARPDEGPEIGVLESERGAPSFDIFFQFLPEAVILSSGAGVFAAAARAGQAVPAEPAVRTGAEMGPLGR